VNVRDVTPVPSDELRSVLEGVLSSHFEAPCRISDFNRAPSEYRSSYALEELGVRLDDGRQLDIVFKDVSRRGLSEAARAAKPAFLYDPRREIRTYLDALNASRLGTPICYGAVESPESGRYWLFLEKVPGRELYQVGAFAVWRRVAEWLGGLHSHFAPRIESLRRTIPLLKYDGDFYRIWPERAVAFVGKSAPANTVRRLEKIAAGYDRVVECLTSLPVTLIHGEFYASNVLVNDSPTGLRVCPVDWEMAAAGTGLIDLAALTSGRWTPREKVELAMAYHAFGERRGVSPTCDSSAGDCHVGLTTRRSPEEFLVAMDYARLHVAMQWLGWAEQWSPPPEHAHDWLDEALTLGDRLGL
jgi:hypothetical protein